MSEKPVRLGGRAIKCIAGYVKVFDSSLSRIATRLARHDDVDSVSETHVKKAYSILAAYGLDRGPWWKRPQLKVTISGVLCAAALAVPDYAPYFAKFMATHVSLETETIEAIIFCIGSVMLWGSALGVFTWSWTQNRI